MQRVQVHGKWYQISRNRKAHKTKILKIIHLSSIKTYSKQGKEIRYVSLHDKMQWATTSFECWLLLLLLPSAAASRVHFCNSPWMQPIVAPPSPVSTGKNTGVGVIFQGEGEASEALSRPDRSSWIAVHQVLHHADFLGKSTAAVSLPLRMLSYLCSNVLPFSAVSTALIDGGYSTKIKFELASVRRKMFLKILTHFVVQRDVINTFCHSFLCSTSSLGWQWFYEVGLQKDI